MALEVGSRLGHYKVTALISDGGMGDLPPRVEPVVMRELDSFLSAQALPG